MARSMNKILLRASLVGLLIAAACGDRDEPGARSQALEAPTPPPAASNSSASEVRSEAGGESAAPETAEKPNS